MRRGLTLLELMIVITIVAILAVAMIPTADSQHQDQVEAAAQIVAADLGYARSLAVTNASKYRVTFNVTGNRYVIEHHDASNGSLDVLPASPFRNPADPPTQQIVRLDDLPRLGAPASIAEVVHVGEALEPATTVEFGRLGDVTDSNRRPVLVVLTVGQGTGKHRAFVVVNPTTGLVTVGTDAVQLAAMIPAEAIGAVDALGR